jgi:hypothetical protein
MTYSLRASLEMYAWDTAAIDQSSRRRRCACDEALDHGVNVRFFSVIARTGQGRGGNSSGERVRRASGRSAAAVIVHGEAPHGCAASAWQH